MTSNKTVVVLTPTGRRQTVKVTLNTTVLQILEEVCKKQELQADEYDLKHHNHVLDTTAIIRFTGLPNNAQLEMCSIQKTRVESSVILGLHLENGTRLTGTFEPSDTLWTVVEQLCPEEINSEKNLVIIYMRNEIYGKEVLQKTNLRSLGLTGGRAMLRVIHRTPEELKVQANVSSALPSKPSEKHLNENKQVSKSSAENKSEIPNNETKTCHAKVQQQNKNVVADFIKQEKSKMKQKQDMHLTNEAHAMESKTKEASTTTESEVDKQKNQNMQLTAKEGHTEIDNKRTSTSRKKNINMEIADNILEELNFLGERNALVFSKNESGTMLPREDLPDEFFELTIQDARKLFSDLKAKREELEDSPLQTSAQRDLEHSKKILKQINQYKKCVIRIHFPDETVLQGTFKPLETVESVKTFVKEYLHNSSLEFYLYTTPPKIVLDPTSTLVDAECVPSAVVHFGRQEGLPQNINYLKKDVCDRFVSPSTASLAAAKLINTNKRESIIVDRQHNSDGVNVGASTSREPDVSPSTEPKNKVPKWYKPNK